MITITSHWDSLMHRCYQINFDTYVCSRRLITESVGSSFSHTLGLWCSPLSRDINDTSCLSNYDLLNFLISIYIGRFSPIWNLFFYLSYERMEVLFRLYVCVDVCIKWVRQRILFCFLFVNIYFLPSSVLFIGIERIFCLTCNS